MTDNFPPVSITVIGFNEADNLIATFTAIKNINYPKNKIEIIYVDSGSTDNSVSIAAQYTDNIFIENVNPSAARNRNRGAKEASHDIVHFLDGDVELHPNYLTYAIKIIDSRAAEAVCGKLLELNRNKISQIIASDWESRKQGYINSTHAGGTYLKKAFLKCHGYNPKMKLGEETELGLRFTEKGYRIYYIEQPMGYHDYGINSMAQYIAKQVNNGKFKVDILLFSEKNSEILNLKKSSISTIVQVIILVFLLLVTLALKPILSLIIFIFFLIFPIIKKVLFKRHTSVLYLALSHYSKPFIFFGQVKRLLFLIKNRKIIRELKLPFIS